MLDYTKPDAELDYTKAGPELDYMKPDPVPKSFSTQAGSQDVDAAYNAQLGGTRSRFSLIKAEDLRLLPGVPILVSNPTAQPWGPVKRTTNAAGIMAPAPAGNGSAPVTDAGAAAGTNPVGDGNASVPTSPISPTNTASSAARSGAGTVGDRQDLSDAIATDDAVTAGGVAANAAKTGGQAGLAQGVSNPPPNSGDGKISTVPGGSSTSVAGGTGAQQVAADEWPKDVPQLPLSTDKGQPSFEWTDRNGNQYEYRRTTPQDVGLNYLRRMGGWHLWGGAPSSSQSDVKEGEWRLFKNGFAYSNIGGVDGSYSLPDAWSEAGLDKGTRDPQPVVNQPPLPPKQQQQPPQLPQQPQMAPPVKPMESMDQAEPPDESQPADFPQFEYPENYAPQLGLVTHGMGVFTPTLPAQDMGNARGNNVFSQALRAMQPKKDVAADSQAQDAPHPQTPPDTEQGFHDPSGVLGNRPEAWQQRGAPVPFMRLPVERQLTLRGGDLMNSLAAQSVVEEQLGQFAQTAEMIERTARYFSPRNPDGFYAMLTRPLINLPEPSEEFKREHPILGGIGAGGAKFLSGFTSPLSIMLMVGTMGAGAVTGRLVAAGFAIVNARQVANDCELFLNERDPEKKAELATGIILTLVMMAAGERKGNTPGEVPGGLGPGGTGLEVPPWEAQRQGVPPANGENRAVPQMPDGEPPPSDTGVKQTAATPAAPPKKPAAAGAKAIPAEWNYMKAGGAGNEEPALVGAGAGKGNEAPKASGGGEGNGGGGGSGGKAPSGSSGGGPRVPDDENFMKPSPKASPPPEGGKGGGGSPPKGQGNKPDPLDFTKKPETPEQAAAREKLAQAMKRPGSISPEEAAKLVGTNPDSAIYRAVETWLSDWKEINEKPDSQQTKLLKELMRTIEPHRNDTLLRGMSFYNEKAYVDFLTQLQDGKGFRLERPFMSASKEPSIANNFASRGVYGLILELRGTYSGKNLEPLAKKLNLYGNQSEVLFLQGSKFRLGRVIFPRLSGEKPYIILEEIP